MIQYIKLYKDVHVISKGMMWYWRYYDVCHVDGFVDRCGGGPNQRAFGSHQHATVQNCSGCQEDLEVTRRCQEYRPAVYVVWSTMKAFGCTDFPRLAKVALQLPRTC